MSRPEMSRFVRLENQSVGADMLIAHSPPEWLVVRQTS